jgi:hypothetical protein
MDYSQRKFSNRSTRVPFRTNVQPGSHAVRSHSAAVVRVDPPVVQGLPKSNEERERTSAKARQLDALNRSNSSIHNGGRRFDVRDETNEPAIRHESP